MSATPVPPVSGTAADLLAQLRDLIAAADHPSTPQPVAPPSAAAERIAEMMAYPVLDAAGVVELGQVSLSTVRRAIKAGDLPSHRVGRRVLIPTHSALAWLGATSVGGEHHGDTAA